MAVNGNEDEGGALVEDHPADMVVNGGEGRAAAKEWTEMPPPSWRACSWTL